MGKPKTNTSASSPTPKRISIIKRKQCKSNDMTNPKFRKELIEKLNYVKIIKDLDNTKL